MMSKKRIVYIITGLSTGGAEMMLLKLIERIDRHQYHPFVISLSTKGEIGARIEKLGIHVEALGMSPKRLLNIVSFFNMIRQLKNFKPDIVHTWMYHADLLGGLAARLSMVDAVCWGIHHSNLDKDKNKLTTRVIMKACAYLSHKLPDRILSCSEMARQIHVNHGYAAKKMKVIPNGFDLSLFHPDPDSRITVRTELGISADTLLVGLIGRFDPQKNHAGFFEAAGMLHKKVPSVHFLLAGINVNESNFELMNAAQDAGVQDVTHFLGLRTDIYRLMTALDIVVVSSSYGEAFPLVIGEAMSCGVPCAVTDVGDSAYIVGDTGRVVPSGDMAGLAAAIEALLVLPKEERQILGERARARIAEKFEIHQIVKQYEKNYEELAEIKR